MQIGELVVSGVFMLIGVIAIIAPPRVTPWGVSSRFTGGVFLVLGLIGAVMALFGLFPPVASS